MVDIAKELKFPFMAGSSIPVAYRPGGVDLELGAQSEARGFYLLR